MRRNTMGKQACAVEFQFRVSISVYRRLTVSVSRIRLVFTRDACSLGKWPNKSISIINGNRITSKKTFGKQSFDYHQ